MSDLPMRRSRVSRLTFTPLLLSVAVQFAYAQDVQLAPITVNADTVSPEEAAQQQARDKSATLGPMGSRRLQDTPYSISPAT
jgi:iron complex outermembrane receptor protein